MIIDPTLLKEARGKDGALGSKSSTHSSFSYLTARVVLAGINRPEPRCSVSLPV